MSTSWLNVVLALVLCSALALPNFSTAQSDMYQISNENRQTQIAQRKYCGRNLSDALQFLCGGVYFQMLKKGGQG